MPHITRTRLCPPLVGVVAAVLSCLGLVAPVLAAPVLASLPGDSDWVSSYHHAGVQGTVSAILSRPGEVIVGGSLTGVGAVPASNVARLATTAGVVTSWSALGAGLDNRVLALAEHEGQVVAGGYFNSTGSVMLNRVARWTGTAWEPFGGGLPGVAVASLASYDGDLYAGAYRWDGNTWTNVLQVNGAVNTLVVRDGLLYVGGNFTTARGDSVAHVFAWDGTQVIRLGGGLPDPVTDGAAWSDGIAFATAGPNDLGNVERWDGAAWVNLARSVSVQSMAAYGSRLVVSAWYGMGGPFHFVPWTGAFADGAWSACGSFVSGAMAVHEGRLLIQAPEGATDGVVSPGLVAWDGAQLQPPFAPADGFDTGFSALLPVGRDVLVGGDYRIANGQPFAGIGIASDSAWAPLGSVDDLASRGAFVDLAAANGVFYGICEYPDYDITARVLGRLAWATDHWQWQPLYVDSWLGGLESIGQDLYVVDAQSVVRVYPYNGVRMPVPGLDLDRFIHGSCVHMGDLVLCGDFAENAGVPCGQVLRRVGEAWQDLGSPFGSTCVEQVASLEGGGLVASYRSSWGAPWRVALFDGAQWTDLGGDFDGDVRRLVLHRGRLFAAGGFHRAGAVPAAGIAMWTGSRWMPVGSGLAGGYATVADMASTPAGLWICGDFATAGGRPCVGLGRWTGDPDQLAGVSAAPPVPQSTGRLLRSAQPNPFNPRTELTLDLPVAGAAGVRIYDARGALVRRLLDADLAAGEHRVSWDGRDDAGRALPSGVYFARLRTAGGSEAVKLTLAR